MTQHAYQRQLLCLYIHCHVHECDYRRGFGLVIGFTDTQLVTTSNYNSLTDLHTLKISVKCSIYKAFYVFTSRFLVMDPNNVLC
jgi:hypothetical protein